MENSQRSIVTCYPESIQPPSSTEHLYDKLEDADTKDDPGTGTKGRDEALKGKEQKDFFHTLQGLG
jgi:hypothetical protein